MAVLIASACNSGDNPDTRIVFRDATGRTLTMADLDSAGGTFRYEVVGSENIPAEASALHEQARQAGANGDYPQAIALLQQASNLAPAWPYPVYDTAFTYLLMEDDVHALEGYRKTLELAPRGFFTAFTGAHTLEREARGELPAGTYLAYLSLEWLDDPAKKAQAVGQLAVRVPGFAPIWKEKSFLAATDDDALADIERGLAANPDAETRGLLLINKALNLHRRGRHDEAVRILGELALDPATTLGNEHLAKASLANITRQ